MFELTHEANVAYQTCTDCITELQNLTVRSAPKSIEDARDFGDLVRKQISELCGAFELFTAGACHELKKKGLFPTNVPPYRKAVLNHSTKETAHFFSGTGIQGYAQPPSQGSGDMLGTLSERDGPGFLPNISGQPSKGGTKSQTPQRGTKGQTPQHNTPKQTDAAVGTGPANQGNTGYSAKVKNASTNQSKNNPTSNNPQQQQDFLYEEEYGVGGGASTHPLGLPSYMPTTGSLGVAGVNKHNTLGVGCCNNPNETVEQLVATSLYFQLEVLVRETLAKEAALFLYQPVTKATQGNDITVEECQAIALFGGKPRPPNNVKFSIKTGVVGAVIRTGMAINITPENPTETNGYALCFPIFPVTGRSAPIGAILLEKKAGNVPFNRGDELVTLQWCKLVTHFVSEFGVNLTQVYFDPHRTLLKKTKPLHVIQKRGAARATPKWIETGPELTVESNVEQLMNRFSGLYSPKLAQMVVAHPTDQLMFRAVHHNHFTTIRGGHIGGSVVTLQTQNLVDVADYVASLEECWKRAADDLQGMEVEHVSRMDDFRDRKKKLKSNQIRMGQLEAVCDHYKAKYESIKRELTVLCGAPVDDEFGGPSGATGMFMTGGGASPRGSVSQTMSFSGPTGVPKPPLYPTSPQGAQTARNTAAGGLAETLERSLAKSKRK